MEYKPQIYLFFDTESSLLLLQAGEEQLEFLLDDLINLNCKILFPSKSSYLLSLVADYAQVMRNIHPNSSPVIFSNNLIFGWYKLFSKGILENVTVHNLDDFKDAKAYDVLYPDAIFCLVSGDKRQKTYNHYFGEDSILNIKNTLLPDIL